MDRLYGLKVSNNTCSVFRQNDIFFVDNDVVAVYEEDDTGRSALILHANMNITLDDHPRDQQNPVK